MTAKNKRSLELRLGKVGLILFIIGMSLLMFGSFMFGVRVGKEMEAYPEKIAGYYPRLFKGNWSWPWDKKNRETEIASEGESKANGAKSNPSLTFYDTLSKKKSSDTLAAPPTGPTAVKDVRTPSGQAETQESPILVGKPVTGLSKVPSKSENVPENKKSSITSQAMTPSKAIGDSASQAGKAGDEQGIPRAPDIKMTGSSKTGVKFVLQVASYKVKSKSDQVSKQMQKLGYNSHVVPVNIKGRGIWYRVIIRGYENEEKAKKAAGELAEKAKGLHAIVRPEG